MVNDFRTGVLIGGEKQRSPYKQSSLAHQIKIISYLALKPLLSVAFLLSLEVHVNAQ